MLSMTEVQPVVVKKSRWRGWQILCLSVVALVGLIWGYRAWRQWQMEARLRTAIAVIEQNDPHWRWPEVLASYEQRPVSAAFLQAMKVFPKGYRGWCGDDIADRPGALPYNSEGKYFNVRMPDTYVAILRERINEQKVQPLRQALLSLMTEADGQRMPWSGRFSFQEIEDIRRLANKITDENWLAIHDGDTRGVIDSFRMALKNAQLLRHGPQSLLQLVSLSLHVLAIERVKQALAFCQFTDAELRELEQILLKYQPFSPREMMRVMRADDYEMLEGAKHDSNKKRMLIDNILGPAASTGAGWQRQISDWANRLYVELAFLNLPELQADVLETISRAMEFSEQESHLRHQFIKEKGVKATNPLAKSIYGTQLKMLMARHTHQAHVDTLRLALACERYRLKHGTWPATLEVLVPEYVPGVPLDPYTGKTLLYRLLDDGVVVYSVWHNESDDGGSVLSTETTSMLDRGVRLFNPEKRGLPYAK
jgi:hypothetical protein